MSDLSDYTSVFSTHSDGRVAKRNRRPVSCTSCRSKKSRCDRQKPCSSCCKRGEAASCDYNPTHQKQDTRSRFEASNRLQRLEEMVNGLITSTTNLSTVITPPSSNESSHDSPDDKSPDQQDISAGGHLNRKGSQVDYIGATHWASILESIHDIRAFLDPEDNDSSFVDLCPQASPAQPKSDPLFGTQTPLTIEEILVVLPPRHVIDSLLAVVFETKFANVPFIHSSKFYREYEAFSKDPHSTSFLWISVLFSMLFLGLRLTTARNQASGLRPSDLDDSVFVKKAAECIVTGEYLKAQPYSVESLLLRVHCIYVFHGDANIAPWPILTMATRLAQKMGYHRDPKHLSGKVTPFEGEMRRRAWYYIEIFDLTMSANQGIPAIINEDECDCAEPSMLLDEDFDETSTVLPSPRPHTNYSTMLFFYYKAKVIRHLRPIIRHALSNRRYNVEETRKLHDALETLHDEIPPVLRIRPVRQSSSIDEDYLIVQRLMMEFQCLKGLCILHRPYLTYEKDNPAYEFFRVTCRDAAIKLLDIQFDYYQEFQPGGRLFESNWMFNNVTLHECFSAAMILCLDLQEIRPGKEGQRARKMETLRNSYQVWTEKKHHYKDAAHASHVLGAMLTKLSAKEPQQALSDSFKTLASPNGMYPTAQAQTNKFQSITSVQDQNLGRDVFYDFMDVGSLSNMLENPDSLDWTTIDHYLRDSVNDMNFVSEQQQFTTTDGMEDSGQSAI